MKDTFKFLRSFVYICIVLGTLFGCTEEKDFVDKNNGIKYRQIPFKELLNQQSFNSAYEKVKQDKQKKSMQRSAIEDEYNFTIVEGKDVKIIEVDNKTFYNILIERDSVSASYFENLLLMVEKINNVDEVSAYIMKYTPTDISTNSNNLNIEKDITPLFSRMTNICYTVCAPVCYNITNDPKYDHVHSPDDFCYNAVGHEEYIILTCSEICRDINVGGETTGPNVNWLKTKTHDFVEHGVDVQRPVSIQNIPSYTSNTVSSNMGLNVELDQASSSHFIGGFHSHPVNAYGIFSFGDLSWLNTTHQYTPSSRKPFVFLGLVALDQDGINNNVYSIKVENFILLQQKINDWLTDPKYAVPTTGIAAIDKKNTIDKIHQILAFEMEANCQNLEKWFLQKFGGFGISLYKTDDNYTEWKKLKLETQNGQLVVTQQPCNN